jgi:hypothetical protein
MESTLDEKISRINKFFKEKFLNLSYEIRYIRHRDFENECDKKNDEIDELSRFYRNPCDCGEERKTQDYCRVILPTRKDSNFFVNSNAELRKRLDDELDLIHLDVYSVPKFLFLWCYLPKDVIRCIFSVSLMLDRSKRNIPF